MLLNQMPINIDAMPATIDPKINYLSHVEEDDIRWAKVEAARKKLCEPAYEKQAVEVLASRLTNYIIATREAPIKS